MCELSRLGTPLATSEALFAFKPLQLNVLAPERAQEVKGPTDSA